MADFEWPDPAPRPEAERATRMRLNGRGPDSWSVERHRRHAARGEAGCPMCVITPDGFKTDNCRSCHAPIIWATTHNGEAMPVDAEIVADGNVIVERSVDGARVIASVVEQATLWEAGGGGSMPRRVAHFVTCPDASGWRKTR